MRYCLFFIFFFLVINVKSQSCDKLGKFESYQNAIETLKKTNFKINDKYSDFSSSWIKSFQYLSCDKKFGYLIMETKQSRKYIHKDVPLALWKILKRVTSKGEFYNEKLRGRYLLKI